MCALLITQLFTKIENFRELLGVYLGTLRDGIIFIKKNNNLYNFGSYKWPTKRVCLKQEQNDLDFLFFFFAIKMYKTIVQICI